MQKKIDVINTARKQLIALCDELTIEQLNDIPAGFNNNILWHLGHVIASQQGLCYTRAGATPLIDVAITDKYKNGTKPEQFIDHDEYLFLKNVSEETLEQLDKDLVSGVLDNYQTFNLSTGLEIASITDALAMLCMHEGMHLGYCQALKRLVQK